MSRIKSAWEIAMEKTQDIQFDEEKLRTTELTKQGKAMAGSYLNTPEQTLDELKAKLASVKASDLPLVKTGVVETIISNISLPSDTYYETRLSRTRDLVFAVAPSNVQALGLMDQIGAFYKQYFDNKEDYVKRMQEQYQQACQENPDDNHSQQFAQILQKNLQRIDEQYNAALENSRESLKALLA